MAHHNHIGSFKKSFLGLTSDILNHNGGWQWVSAFSKNFTGDSDTQSVWEYCTMWTIPLELYNLAIQDLTVKNGQG